MRDRTENQDSILLYPLRPWPQIATVIVFLCPWAAIALLTDWLGKSNTVRALLALGGLAALSMAVVWMEYFACHVTASAAGIEVVRWKRKE